MTTFEEVMRELENDRCQPCYGTGALNDAESGDIYYKAWECTHCEGTGLASKGALWE